MNWQMTTSDPIMHGYVMGYKILLLEIPFQNSLSHRVKTTKLEKLVVLKEIEEILKKEAITPVKHKTGQCLCSTFIVAKKSDGFRAEINLKKLNSCVKYKYFKMKGIFLLNELL